MSTRAMIGTFALIDFISAGRRESDRRAAAGIAAQVAGAAVPVGKHPALAGVAVDHVHVTRRAVRVTVDEAGIAERPQGLLHGGRRDVHDLHRLAQFAFFALRPDTESLLA